MTSPVFADGADGRSSAYILLRIRIRGNLFVECGKFIARGRVPFYIGGVRFVARG